MQIEFLFTGKTTERWVEKGMVEYLERIRRYARADVKVVNAPSAASPALQRKKEAELILSKVNAKDVMVLLDEKGKQFTSGQFAAQLNKWMGSGKQRLVFVVGGAYGADESLVTRADLLLSFSAMTFTHQMIRPLLTEQVYRAFTILKNEKYHHE